jgi:O-antigen/teichoic acid export membrane protein
VNAISSFVVLTITWRYIHKKVGARLFCAIDYKAAWELIKRSRYAFGGAVMLYFYGQFDVVIISYFTNPTQAGFYRAANTFISPMALLVSVSDAILFPRLAIMHKASPQQFLKHSARLSGLYAAAAVVTAFVVVPLCGLLLTRLFGAKYSSAVLPAQILILSTCVSVVCGPFRWGLMAGNRDGMFFMNSALIALVAVALNIVLVPHFGASGAAFAKLLSQLVLFLSSGVLCYRLFGR